MVVRHLLVSVAAVAALSGCVAALPATVMFEPDVKSSVKNANAPAAGPLAPAPLPHYSVGDRFYYSDGRSEEVIGLKNGLTQWQDDMGNRWTGSNDFTFPYTQRQTALFSETVNISGTPGEMWPLRQGKGASHTSKHEVTGALTKRTETVHAHRSCDVDGIERVNVGAGQFNTFRVVCDRYSMGRWQQRSTIWYAPELGHPVRIRERYNRTSGTDVELAGTALSFSAIPEPLRDKIENAWVEALENNASGTASSWKSQDGRNGITVTPLRSFRSRSQQYCRQIQVDLTADGTQRRGNAIACRGANGNWAYTGPRTRVRMGAGGA